MNMSVPNVGHLDAQLGGCCTVMPFYIGDILELPLTTTQDYSLFNILNVLLNRAMAAADCRNQDAAWPDQL